MNNKLYMVISVEEARMLLRAALNNAGDATGSRREARCLVLDLEIAEGCESGGRKQISTTSLLMAIRPFLK